MSPTHEPLADLLGAAPEDLALLESRELPTGTAALGDAGMAPRPLSGANLTDVTRVMFADPDLYVATWNPDPRVLLLRAADTTVLAGQAKTLLGELLEVRGGAAVRLRTKAGLRVLETDGRSIRLWSLVEPPSRLAHLAAQEIPEALPFPGPDFGSLTVELGVEPWLAEEAAARLATGAPLALAAGLGLLIRLHHPSQPEDVRAQLARLRSGMPPLLLVRLRGWAVSVPASLWGDLADAARLEADALPDVAEALDTLGARDPSAARLVAAGVVARRDDLEGVLALLQALRRPERMALAAHLRCLDDALSLRHTALGDALAGEPPLPTEHGVALARYEPESWWSVLGREE